MSDAQTVWKLGVALACAWGAWSMKVGSGVSDDQNGRTEGSSKARDLCGDVSRSPIRSGFLGSGPDRGATMKEADGHQQQNVIDFETGRNRILMRRWAVANGFARVRDTVK